jgi:xanthine dehydrogenase accessory factor
MYNPRAVFRFIAGAEQARQRCVLVTVTDVTGASTRSPGAHLAVSEDGRFAGSISGGCVEAAVVAEAIDVLKADEPRQVRFGAGSPYLDIRLPCGGGVDLMFSPLEAAFGARALGLLDRRQPLRITLPFAGAADVTGTEGGFSITIGTECVEVTHIPPLRLALIGHGATVDSLAVLAGASAADVAVLSSDADQIARALERGDTGELLTMPTMSPGFRSDDWTGLVFLFHDHDWEPRLLARMLEQDAFFIGAMGSRKTHADRVEALRALGVAPAAIDRIVAPIGLIPSMRDPETLAVSILAQVVGAYNARFLAVRPADATGPTA